MKNTILHPTDFSECANDALDYAIEIAKVLNCKIRIVHSLVFEGELSVTQTASAMLKLTEVVKREAEESIKVLGDKVIANNIECEGSIFTGDISAWLPNFIADNKPVLVVMGTKGSNTVSSKLFGSNTYSIIKNSEVPVLAVPKFAKYKKPFDIFVLSTDFRSKDLDAVKFLAKLAKPSNVKIDVIHVLNEEASKKSNNQILLDNLEKKVKEQEGYDNIEYKLLYSEDPETRLKILVEEEKPDMLTLVMRKQGFFERLLFGSLTEKLVHTGNIPLLVFSAE